MLELHIGNKNYSSWSMRPWVLLRQAGIPFTEVMHRFDSFDADSGFKRTISAVSPVGKVPVLVDGDLAVWDTLAIAEYLAETYPEKHLYPVDKFARARARSLLYAADIRLAHTMPIQYAASIIPYSVLYSRNN